MYNILRRLIAIWILSLGFGLILYSLINLSSSIQLVYGGSGLYIGSIIIGIFFVILANILFKGLYVQKKGIIINPKKIAIIWDVLTLLFAVPAAFVVIDTLLVKILNVPTMIVDEFGQFMGIFFFIVGIPILTMFVSSMTGQSVLIDINGVTVNGTIEKKHITWTELEDVRITDQTTIIPRGGIPFPQQIQKQLILKDSKSNSIALNEPQFKSVKRELILQLVENAPEKWKSVLQDRLRKW